MQKGDFVKIDYVGRVKETGEIFDLTKEDIAKKEKILDSRIKYRPVPVIIGENFVIVGLDSQLEKMNVGEKKKLVLPPSEAFGERDPKMVKVMPKSAFRKQNIEPVPGLVINMSGYRGKIQSCDSGRVRVDFNNPLAGKELEYEIEITEKIEEPSEQVRSIFEFLGIEGVLPKIDGKNVEIEISHPLPPEIKARIASLVTKHVSSSAGKIENVKFSELFGKPKDEPANEAEK